MKITALSVAVVAVGAAAVYVALKGAKAAGQEVAGGVVGAAVDLVDGVFAGTVETVGEVVGIPKTSIPYALQLLDQWDATPWYEKAGLSFRISAALPLADYLKWLADSSYRPTLQGE